MPGRTDTGSSPTPPRLTASRRRRSGAFSRRLRRAPRGEIEKPGPRKGVMPGVRELLDALAPHDEVYLALLTGNYEAGGAAEARVFRSVAVLPLRRLRRRCPESQSACCRERSRALQDQGGPALQPSRRRRDWRYAARRRVRGRRGRAVDRRGDGRATTSTTLSARRRRRRIRGSQRHGDGPAGARALAARSAICNQSDNLQSRNLQSRDRTSWRKRLGVEPSLPA